MNSLTLQKNLPRPKNVPEQLYEIFYEDEFSEGTKIEVEKLIETEMLNLMTYDNSTFPL
jgi:hypothetical protein